MIFDYIHTNGEKEEVTLSLEQEIDSKWVHINTTNKLEFIKKFLPAYHSGQKIVLFDPNHRLLLDFYQSNNINELEGIDELDQDCQVLFFTSGSSGFPLGAFKTKQNLEKEIDVLKSLVAEYKIKRVVVTVPFVHIYGVLAGLLLPFYLGVRLIIKEDFLPYELLEEAKEENTLVITTPVFIKSLSKLKSLQNMSSSLFICSTGPLQNQDVEGFENTFQSNIMQLFGSTETGGVAYKFHASDIWKPLPGVKVSTCDGKLNIESGFLS
ncbi:AMP-binding protein, partial [Campylobacterota bacterium]